MKKIKKCNRCNGEGKTIKYNGFGGIAKQVCSKCHGKGVV